MRILLAEDGPAGGSQLELLLGMAGHEVQRACSGYEAFAAFEREPFPVVVADLAVAGMNGYELCRRIRDRVTPEYNYFILLVKTGLELNFSRAEAAEVDDVLTLPVDPDILRARIRVADRILTLYRERDRLRGLIPVCAYCKKIRKEPGLWQQIEAYITEHSDAMFTHTICPECAEREFPDSLRARQAQHH